MTFVSLTLLHFYLQCLLLPKYTIYLFIIWLIIRMYLFESNT